MSQVRLVIGLGFGDEGKGQTVHRLAELTGSKLVVRFNGGSQAAHNVIDSRGVHHNFSQFGSGSFFPGVETYLSRFMLVNPLNILAEAEILAEKIGADPLLRMMIDESCPIITPLQVIINQMKETAADAHRKSSCGKGIGETVSDLHNLKEMMLFAGDLKNLALTREKLKFLQLRKLDLAEQLVDENPCRPQLLKYLKRLQRPNYVEKLAQAYLDFAAKSGVRILPATALAKMLVKNNSIFEGAQGVLLDAEYGFWPHVTPTKTTFANALTLLAEANFTGEVEKIGVIRAYATRHGNGPFPSHDLNLEKAIPDCHNVFSEWQSDFRIGWFDLPLAKYALQVCGGVDQLVITNTDRLFNNGPVKVVEKYSFSPADNLLAREFLRTDGNLRFRSLVTRDHQQNLGNFLSRCRPNLKIVEQNLYRKNYQTYVHWLEKKLGISAQFVSLSPNHQTFN